MCPEGKSNDGTNLTNVSQCLGVPSSLEVRVAGEDALSLQIGYPDDDGGANVTHYKVFGPGTGALTNQVSLTDTTNLLGVFSVTVSRREQRLRRGPEF